MTIENVKGYNITGSIVGLFDNVMDADWWSVDHQSTDFFIIGILTTPIKTSTEKNLSALSLFSKDACKEIKPRYIMNKINVEVILASHCHQVPHVGIPQIEPENSAKKVTIAPIGAIDLDTYAANLSFQIRKTAEVIAITTKRICAMNDAGTCI